MRERHERVHGPYPHGKRWRIRLVRLDGESSVESFATEAEALDKKAEALGEVTGHSVAAAVDLYLEHCRAKGLRSVTTIGYRLRALLQTTRDRPLRQLTPAAARELFARRVAQVKVKADTQAGELAAARRFAAWCREQGWIGGEPFAGLEATGPRARGKKQLRIDEARRFVETALGEGSEAGLAAAMALLMGLRASEVTGRVVRDLDDDGRALVVEQAKTRVGDRRLEVPAVLRPRLLALAAGRRGDQRLFGAVDRHWLGYHVRRLCGVAAVPEVCPHALRGTQASIAAGAVPVEHVAQALGQTGPAVTRRHYLAAGAEQDGRQRAALRVLQGGRR